MLSRPRPKTATLERQKPSFWQHELVIKISITTLIILAVMLFCVICYFICPPTYGYFWY